MHRSTDGSLAADLGSPGPILSLRVEKCEQDGRPIQTALVLSHCSLSSSAHIDFVRLAFFPRNLLQAIVMASLFDLKCSLHVRRIDEPASSRPYI